MALISEIMDRPLDPGYAAEAESRRRSGQSTTTGYRTPLLLVAGVLIGFLLAVAALSLRAPESAAQQTREDLISQIEQHQAGGDGAADEINLLRGQIEQLRSESLEDDEGGLAAELEQAAEAVGAVALDGPGVRITMDDAPASEEEAAGEGEAGAGTAGDPGRVTSRDLQVVVNALWASGAEAISINGQRLTVHSAIRFAGEAIIVGFRGLARPYVITAIGAPDEMLEQFEDGAGGRYLTSLRDELGIVGEVEQEDSVTVPAASRLNTRLATPLPDHTPSEDPRPLPAPGARQERP